MDDGTLVRTPSAMGASAGRPRSESLNCKSAPRLSCVSFWVTPTNLPSGTAQEVMASSTSVPQISSSPLSLLQANQPQLLLSFLIGHGFERHWHPKFH